jgi:energy-coupling factor transporter ATP-binding protein EcfA2
MTPSVPFNPFPGLRHFETSEEYLFFGREGQSEEILRRLGQNRLVAVVGTSGSGKSSLVRAGLLPYLYGGFLANAGSHWRVALFRPGSDPIGNLARSLNSPEVLGAAGEDESDARSAMLLEVTLRRSGLGLVDAVKQARLAAHENVLVIVDQFEELFRFTGAGELNRSEDDAAAFVKLLLEAGQQTDLPVYVALTMRSDWIGDCARFRDLPEAVAAGLYLIPRMTRDQRRAAIEEPVGVAQGQISSRLVNRLLNDVGDNPDQLPILQHAMMRSWDFWSARRSDGTPLDLQDYAAIGTMANALSKHADEAYEELSTDRQRAIAKRIFQALTDKGADNREVRRPTSVAILVQDTGADYAEVLAVIESFRRRGRSFLMPPEDVGLTGDTIIDISHESLIRGWQRLREWVEEESESAKVYRRLADTAVLHAQNKAGLWRDPDLLNALTWRETQHPTNSWAQRYHPQFDLALAFLENSRRERDAERAEEERKRNEELHRTRRQLAVLGTVCAIALAFLASALYEKFNALAKATEANRLAEQYSKQKDYADSNFQRAVIAETQAKQNALAADVARAGETIKKIEAERALVKAREQTEQADRMRTEAAAQAKVAKENEGIALGYARDSINAFNDLSGEIKIQTDVQKFYAQLLQGALDVHTRVLKNDPDNRDALFLGVVNRVTIPDLRNTQGLNAEAEAECAKNEQYAEDESAKTKS